MRIKDLPTVEDRRTATTNARRESRFKFAEERIRRIVAAAPPLTQTQKAKLAAILLDDEAVPAA